LRAITRALKRRSKVARQARRSMRSTCRAAAIACSWLDTTKPVTPSSTISGTDPWA
jgi:hypothetical protein